MKRSKPIQSPQQPSTSAQSVAALSSQFPKFCGIDPESEIGDEAASAADDWEDDYLFTQPDVIQIIDTQVQNVIRNDTAVSKVREYCKLRTGDVVLSQFHPEVSLSRNAASETHNLLSADEIYIGLDRLNQECEKYKIEAERLQQRLTVKEGEIKILREWKANRDREELRKQSQSCAAMQALRVREQEAQLQHRAAANSLRTQIQFLEQEKQALEEKLLEERRLRTAFAAAATGDGTALAHAVDEPMDVAEAGRTADKRNRSPTTNSIQFPDVRSFYSNKKPRKDTERVVDIPAASVSAAVQTEEGMARIRPFSLKHRCRIKKSVYEVYIDQLQLLAHEHPPTIAEKIAALKLASPQAVT